MGTGHDHTFGVAGLGFGDHVADAVAVQIELGCADVPAGLTQYADYVVDACVVPGARGRPGFRRFDRRSAAASARAREPVPLVAASNSRCSGLLAGGPVGALQAAIAVTAAAAAAIKSLMARS